MPESEVDGVRTAALLHDIGKLAVPEHILAKPGVLTPEESQKMRSHAEVGAEIIANVPFPYPVAPLILSHHERWDGRGYPEGLRETAIPLGARIIAIVDHFDALTSERPHRTAVTHDEALAVLQREAGHGLDPHAVRTFIDILPELLAEVHRNQLRLPLRGPAPSSPLQLQRPSVLGDIALAHREIYALYQIAQTMGTSLGVSDHGSHRIETDDPDSVLGLRSLPQHGGNRYAAVLFRHRNRRAAARRLVSAERQGADRMGARNRRSLVNARPSEDLEAGHVTEPTALQSILSCPLIFGDRYPERWPCYHLHRVSIGTTIADCSTRCGTGGGRGQQLDRLRADP